jgi:hypothetical protein
MVAAVDRVSAAEAAREVLRRAVERGSPMPDQEDDAELKRWHRAAVLVQGSLERADLVGVLARRPELRVLFDPWTDPREAAEAQVRSAIRDYAELGDKVMARRLEKALARPTKPGVKRKWGEVLSRQYMFEAMRKAIVDQPKPNVMAAARTVAAQEKSEEVTAGALRHAWNELAKEWGLKSGAEMARRVWQDARGPGGPSA